MNCNIFTEFSDILTGLAHVESHINSNSFSNSEEKEKCLARKDRLEEALISISEKLPSGSGFDSGIKLVREKSDPEKLVFQADFHHMDSHGFYCGWSDHLVTVTPIFGSVKIKVSGVNKRGIKEYIQQVFYNLNSEVYVKIYHVTSQCFKYVKEK